jgi:hypothetical protein
MRSDKPHILIEPYGRHCSDCHHDREQETSCRTCHAATADYFAGRFGGELIGRGTHGRSDEVGCADCHVYEAGQHRFVPPESTCAKCHPKAYLALFAETQREWQAWRTRLEAAGGDSPVAQQRRFIARNWYHNDVHATAQRRGAADSTRKE